MAKNDLKILGAWPSPYVMRPRIALNIKSLAYDFLEEQFGTKSDLLLKSNPIYKKIPVLIHDGKPICESLIIVQYIDENWTNSGPSILPSHPYDRAIARFWATYIDDKWFPSLRGIAAAQGEDAKKAATELVVEGLVLLEDVFKNSSKGQKFFGGDTIGYLDIALGCFLGWLRVTEKMNNVTLLNESKTPGLYKWAEDFCADSAVKDVMPETDKLAEAAKSIDETWTNSGPSILPSDPYDRAIARFWASYIDDKWFPLLRVLAVAQGDHAIKAALEPLVKGLVLLEEVFKNCSKGKFFGGEKIGYLDIALGCFLGWMRVPQKMNNVKLLDEAKTPGLHKWAGDFCADSVVKDVMPQTDKLAEAAKVLLPKIRANASS
ncbi:Glutathione S-transferase U17 [Capsicum annuum]|nr:Glutathione S-transferase U17 [Capsicum annuum]